MEKINQQKLLHRFRITGIAEGISFLVLLLIAMPLKYLMHIPEAVKYTGWVHGALFITFIYFAFEVMGTLKKNFYGLPGPLLLLLFRLVHLFSTGN